MRKSLLSIAVLSALAMPAFSYADEAAPAAAEAAKEPASPWTLTANVGLVSNYYARGVSQSWNMPAVQGGADISHSSGFYAGIWTSSVSERTYVGSNQEIDIYAGYNGSISAVEGLGWTVGAIGYYYPGGSWSKYAFLTDSLANGGNEIPGDGITGKKTHEDFTTWEANFGLSYKWVSAKVSYTLTNWYGAQKSTGWTSDSDGSLYYELNASVPLPFWGLNLIGHVGRLDVKGQLSTDPLYANANLNTDSVIVERSADMTDYKLGLTKSFDIAGTSGWNAGLYYVGGTNGGNNGYWGTKGYGGSSFTTTPGSKDLTDDTFILTLGRTF